MNHKFKFFSILISCLIATAVLGSFWQTLTAAPVPSSSMTTSSTEAESNPCESVTVISPTECAALVTLYTNTDGPNWLTNTNWLSLTETITPCDWYGVTCANNHVVELKLNGNQLSGTLPNPIGAFPELTTLYLQNNQLKGTLPTWICFLQDTVTTADFAYNKLNTFKSKVRDCMNTLDPDWRETQTIPPRNLTITEFYTDALTLSWDPIPYTADGGYYEIRYALDPRDTFTVHGQTADKTADSYLLDGLDPGRTYYITVRSFTPAHDEQPADLLSNRIRTIGVTKHPTEKILLMVYVSADNDLSPNVSTIGTRLMNGSQTNPNLQVVLLTDEFGEGNTRLTEIANGVVTFTNAISDSWGTTELDTADPAVLAWFLNHAQSKFPASRTIVSIVGHGLALTPEIIWPDVTTSRTPFDALGGPIPPLPQGSDFTPGDVTDRNYLSPIDLRHAFMEATNNGADPFDIVFFDQCFQGNLDTLYEVRTAADVFIASPNYAWLIAAYDQYLTQMAPAEDNAAMAQAIIERYQGALPDRGHPNVIFWITQSDIEQIATAVNTLADALTAATLNGFNSPILSSTQNSQFVDTTQCFPNQLFNLTAPDELIGLESFVENLQQGFPVSDPFGVHTAAAEVETLLSPISRTVNIGNPYVAPQYQWNYTNTLTILAPLPRKSPAQFAWRASIYTETTPLTAVWAPDPTISVTISEPLALVQDGRWDNFLNVWYTDLDTPTVGQWCHYIPPAIVTTDETEAISLTVTAAGPNSATLNWTETTDERAVGYQLLVNGPNVIGWTIREMFPVSQTTFTQEGLTGNTAYQLQILAVDAAGTVLEQSNEAVWLEQVVALPLIIRP